ncbi:hypothetical protein PDG61_02070 [Mycolicibacterium sp. BiH015]|uniref:hypothetical protein n=1 Tax=Mycolicibacterium sp. BiH015 TaxID=3018808 RepID=UPI0022E3BFDD|nr:hypothetical protein [Mycolicibacterium sp. BiH015]MDA2889690.1 hypothetical protein [Mycolicibacterium sp. BiH015]
MIVDRIEPDDVLLACTTLKVIDHVDAHLLRTDARRSPQQWSREILENVSATRQLSLRAGWTLLGIKLRHGDRDAVAGWSVAYDDAEYIRLRSDSFTGLTGELVTRVTDAGVEFATFVRVDGAVARFLWDRALTAHLMIVATLLAEAGERVR